MYKKNKDTSGQPAADNSSNEESTTGMPARAGTPAIAGRQQKRPPQLLSFSANLRKNLLKSKQKTCLASNLDDLSQYYFQSKTHYRQ
jgi:hypothetical protein